MTEDEIKVLSYVDADIGGPDTIVKRLRPTFHDLIARGFVCEVTSYVVSDTGAAALAPYQPLPPLPECD